MHLRSIVQKIKKLAAVNLVEGDVKFQVCVHVEELNYIVRGKQIETRNNAITRAHHCKCFSTTSLSVGKACCFGAFECLRD